VFNLSLKNDGKSAHLAAVVAIDVTVDWVTTTNLCLQCIQLQPKGLLLNKRLLPV